MISSDRLTPTRCPSTRSKPLLTAQRPLPSMMMAMCFGSFFRLMEDMRERQTLNLRDLFFFPGNGVIYPGHMLIGEFLNGRFGFLQIVFRDFGIFLEFFQGLHRLPARVTHGHPPL